MKKPDFTPQQIEWISEEIIGEEEEPIQMIMMYEMLNENARREIRNELRREQERRLREDY